MRVRVAGAQWNEHEENTYQKQQCMRKQPFKKTISFLKIKNIGEKSRKKANKLEMMNRWCLNGRG
ncbi:hypothetical protein [Halalkalibacter alkaliphilus]|uniref:Uncharacterized protein n=1 Tax=Halalkalibacter alkaliphilus TaxID=2917993 RepID=A0A9X2I7N3_9BACI|nr:hypothetical protein [Halalkalibacter alkaliphilus]MCL7747805.1 hypothetical protein [Halalkalibacter alkaliphilus]